MTGMEPRTIDGRTNAPMNGSSNVVANGTNPKHVAKTQKFHPM
jgi:hypothetical protein